MMRYSFNITHVSGKALITADVLSRVPLQFESTESLNFQESAETFISAVVEAFPASANRLPQIATAQSTDPILQVTKYCQKGWPAKHSIKGLLKPYWCVVHAGKWGG